MSRNNRPRRKCVPQVDGLEQRGLMTAGLRSAFFSHQLMRSISSLVPPIRGTIHGTITQITPLSARSQEVSYTAVAKANIIGDGRGGGHHMILSRPLRHGGTLDLYRNSAAAVKGTTDTVAIGYNGTGRTQPDGSFTANWRGTARSIAGLHAGLAGSFNAHASGNARTGDFTINILIRL